MIYSVISDRSHRTRDRSYSHYGSEILIFLLPMKKLNILMPAPAAKSLQSCQTLYNPTDGSPPGSPVPGILQARTLEWVAISFSNAWKWKLKVKSLSRVQLFTTPWTAAYQASPSMGFSRQEYWSGLPLLSPILMPKTSLFSLSNSNQVTTLQTLEIFQCHLNLYCLRLSCLLQWFLKCPSSSPPDRR